MNNLLKLIRLRNLRVSIMENKLHHLTQKLGDHKKEREKLNENRNRFSFIYRTYSEDEVTQDIPLRTDKYNLQKINSNREKLLVKMKENEIKIESVINEVERISCEMERVNEDILLSIKDRKKLEIILEKHEEND